MINVHHALSIRHQAQLASISRGSAYYCQDQSVPQIWRSCAALTSCTWNTHSWARMLRDQFDREGFDVGRKHVGTLMKRMGNSTRLLMPNNKKLPK